ncbi:MAG: NUDIX domain-containing protein [Armatimonadetes bacterium]|nr:NUDIX domain-containing protein [Armatimonadota bacterium]
MAKTGLKVRAVAVTVHQGKVLLVESNHSPGSYVPPGGTIEHRELASQCAAREVAEETGVNVSIGRLIGIRQAFWPQRDSLELYYSATVSANARNAAGGGIEGRRFRWVPLDELHTVPHFPGELGTLCALATTAGAGVAELPPLDLTQTKDTAE